MDNENETRPLLHSFQSETWHRRARKRCMRIPSEITITGIILGLFLIVVTLLIVLENMESDKKVKNISLNDNLLASPMKYNKKADDQTWQDKKDYMKFKDKQMEEKNRKLDKINKGWKQLPDLSASPMHFIKTDEDQSWPDTKDYIKMKEKKMEEKSRKWDKVNKGWKKLPDISGNIHDHGYEEKQKNLNNDLETVILYDKLDVYGKEIEDSLETFANLQMGSPSEMEKFKQEVLEVKNLLHSGINWKIIDDGWKTLSDQGWREKDIRRALMMALNEKRQEIRKAQLENILQSPMNIEDIWDQINDSWKKNLHKGNGGVDYQKIKVADEAEDHLAINDEWRKEMNILQSPKSDMKNFIKEDEGWQKLVEQGWKGKDIEEKLIKAWKDPENVMQSPLNMEDLWVKATDFLRNFLNKVWKDRKTGKSDEDPKELQMNFDDFSNIIQAIKDHQKGMDDQEMNDEIVNILESSYKKWKKNEDFNKKHTKDDSDDKNTDEIENENNQPQQSPVNFEDFIEVIEAIREKERNSFFGRNDGDDATSSPGNIPLQKSMPFPHPKQDKMGKEWQKIAEQGLNEKDMKEAVYKAWKNGDKLRKSAFGQNDMKWKKVNDGWKTISNKSAIFPSRCPLSNYQKKISLGVNVESSSPIDCALIAENVRREFGRCVDLSFLPKECKPVWKEKCFTTYKYRKMDGGCNNKIHPTWGKSGIPFIRMIAPDYADGVSALRAASDGGALPNPRLLSEKLYSKRTKPHSDTTILFMYFGLLVDHDMIETAQNPGDIPCCDEDFKFHPLDLPKECLQIDISKDDPFYGPKNVFCLNLVRSAPVNGECAGIREQMNKATSFLDGSVVYGSADAQAKQLRTFTEGQLRTQLINNTPFMAYADGVGAICGTPTEPLKCFEAGDSRVNMMVELAAMHTLWYREHNRIAAELHKLNPKLRDEILYQEARRILIAEFQHITYNEFLPLVLGEKAVKEYALKIDKSRYYDGYDNTINPSIFNVFVEAAFRFGHSLVPDVQYLLGPKNSTQGKVFLHETFFNVGILHHDGFDLLLRGAATQRTQTVDSYISPEVREHLFQPSNLDYGYDLAAVGIQRGRDHGLPGYIRWRSVCGLSEVKSWDDLYKVMDKERVDMFKDIYKSVQDIDLIPGSLAESHEEGALVGPTYTCLLGRQFERTRKGDRFWFENRRQIGSLSKEQLDEIYKSSMARIVCDNSDNITEIQVDPFKVPSSQNVYVKCDTIPKVDLSKWSSVV